MTMFFSKFDSNITSSEVLNQSILSQIRSKLRFCCKLILTPADLDSCFLPHSVKYHLKFHLRHSEVLILRITHSRLSVLCFQPPPVAIGTPGWAWCRGGPTLQPAASHDRWRPAPRWHCKHSCNTGSQAQQGMSGSDPLPHPPSGCG